MLNCFLGLANEYDCDVSLKECKRVNTLGINEIVVLFFKIKCSWVLVN